MNDIVMSDEGTPGQEGGDESKAAIVSDGPEVSHLIEPDIISSKMNDIVMSDEGTPGQEGGSGEQSTLEEVSVESFHDSKDITEGLTVEFTAAADKSLTSLIADSGDRGELSSANDVDFDTEEQGHGTQDAEGGRSKEGAIAEGSSAGYLSSIGFLAAAVIVILVMTVRKTFF